MRMPGVDPMSKEEIEERGKKDYNVQKLSDLEMLILKPHRENTSITDLTEEEIKEYLDIDIEMLEKVEKENKEAIEKTGLSEKLIRICAQTQKYIKENLEDILTVIRQKNAEKTEKEDKEHGQDR